LNDVLRQQLVQTFSVNNNTRYPNSIVKAILLLSTFKKQVNSSTGNANAESEVAVVSYHETSDYNECTPGYKEANVDDTNIIDIAMMTVMSTVQPKMIRLANVKQL
jgi:hypothetical protein